MPQSTQLHGTAVSLDGRGVLLLGESGAGKSDLALRLIDRGARLVADDRVDIVREDDTLMMSAPRRLAGLLEVRGLGIVRTTAVSQAPLELAVRLVPREAVERLPDRTHEPVLGIPVKLLYLDAFDLSAPIKVEWAVTRALVSTECSPQ